MEGDRHAIFAVRKIQKSVKKTFNKLVYVIKIN